MSVPIIGGLSNNNLLVTADFTTTFLISGIPIFAIAQGAACCALEVILEEQVCDSLLMLLRVLTMISF